MRVPSETEHWQNLYRFTCPYCRRVNSAADGNCEHWHGIVSTEFPAIALFNEKKAKLEL